jgi:hypothetical protein
LFWALFGLMTLEQWCSENIESIHNLNSTLHEPNNRHFYNSLDSHLRRTTFLTL